MTPLTIPGKILCITLYSTPLKNNYTKLRPFHTKITPFTGCFVKFVWVRRTKQEWAGYSDGSTVWTPPRNPINQTPHLPITSSGIPKVQNSPPCHAGNYDQHSHVQQQLTGDGSAQGQTCPLVLQEFSLDWRTFHARRQRDKQSQAYASRQVDKWCQVSRQGANCLRS